MNSVTPKLKEFLLIAAFSAFVVLLGFLPILLGYRQAPPGTRGVVQSSDEYTYLSWINQAREGNTLFTNLYTHEQTRNLLFFPFFLFWGLAGKVIPVDIFTLFNISRLVTGFACIIAIYYISKSFLESKGRAFIFTFFATFASSFGWLDKILPSSVFIYTWQGHEFVFFQALLYPHFIFATTLLLLTLALWLKYKKIEMTKPAPLGMTKFISLPSHPLFIFLTSNILLLTHPYQAAALIIVPAVFELFYTLKSKRVSLKNTVLMLLLILPTIAYLQWLRHTEPAFEYFSSIATIFTPFPHRFLELAAAFAIPLGFGIYWAKNRKRGETAAATHLFILAWLFFYIALVSLNTGFGPIRQPRKMLEGVQLPLAYFALLGFKALTAKISRRKAILFSLFLLLFSLLGNFYYILKRADYPRLIDGKTDFPPYASQELFSALNWLKENSKPSEIVIADPDLAAAIPAVSGNRVFAGHWGNTLNFAKKRRLLNEILRRETKPNYRWLFFGNLPATFYLENRRLAEENNYFNPAEDKDFREVFRSGEYRIYRFQPQKEVK